MNLFNKIIFSLCVILLALSCSKDRLKEETPSLLTADLLFQTKDGFEYALNGLHDEVRRYRSGEPSGSSYNSVNNIMNVQAVSGVDNAYGNWRDPLMDVFNLYGTFNNPSASHHRIVFTWLYETINAANTIVNRSATTSINWTEADKNRIVAEARCIRAWCYRHLTNLWGDVPLTLEESSGTNIKTDWQRTPVAEVRKAMEEDLIFAAENLPNVSTGDIRLIKGVAQHYLAELYLATGQYDKAKAEATKVTSNLSYRLVTSRYGNQSTPGTPFSDLFIEGKSKRSQGNTEALWVIQNEQLVVGGEANNIMRRSWVNRYYSWVVGGKNPVQISAENGGRGIGRLSPTRFALNLYAPNDERGSAFIFRYYYILRDSILPSGTNVFPTGINPRTAKPYRLGDTLFLNSTSNETLSNPNWPSTRKWDYTSNVDVLLDPQYNDQVLLRTAETYLVLAEANFRLGDLQGAADAINVLRARAKATAVTSAQITIDFILDERSRELFSEEDRRYALVRTNKLVERVRLYNKISANTIQLRDTLLPIPQAVIDANLTSKMRQNNGY
jgi:hypothetical protein